MSPRCEGVWVLEDVMLVPEPVVWGPRHVWVLEQVGAVPKRKICAPGEIQTRIIVWSCSVQREAPHIPLLYCCSQLAHIVAIFRSFVTVCSRFVLFCR